MYLRVLKTKYSHSDPGKLPKTVAYICVPGVQKLSNIGSLFLTYRVVDEPRGLVHLLHGLVGNK